MRSTISRRGCAAVAAVLLAGGCELTFPWSSGDLPDGPRDLVAAADPADFDLVHLTWTPAPRSDRYELQVRAGGDPWQMPIPWIPADATSLAVRVSPTTPERTQLAFRLRAVVGGSPSRWSGDAALLRGIRPPSSFAAGMGVGYPQVSPVTVTWTNASEVATAIALERSTLDGGGNPTTWAPLADASLAPGAYVDRRVADGAAYAYRVRVGADGLWSVPREARTQAVDLAAPWGLRAVVESGGVRLTWTNQSTTAAVVTVSRCLGGCVASTADLPPTSETWLDTEVMPVSPAMTYQVRASRAGASISAWSEIAQVEPFTIAGPPALAASARLLPPHDWAARDAAGRFHLALQGYTMPRLHRATEAGHDTYLLPGAFRIAEPGVALDAAGAPHTVYLRFADGAGPPIEVVHAWWDGGAWQTEVVARDDVAAWSSAEVQARFGLDGSGGLQVLYRRAGPFPARDALVHVSRGGAGWTAAQVATPSVPDLSRWSYAFAVGPDGSAHVAQLGQSVVLNRSVIVLSTRSPEGAWSDELVPAAGFSLDGPWLVAGAGGDVAVAYFGAASADVEVVRRREGTWSAPGTAVARVADGYAPSLALVASSDLGRLALLAASGGRLGVHVDDGTGWQGVGVAQASAVSGSIGLGADGVWVLLPSGWGDAPPPYGLFEEIR